MKEQFNPLDAFRAFLSRFKVGEPIQSLFKPKFEVCYNFARDEIAVSLLATAPDALGLRPQINVGIKMPLPDRLRQDGPHYDRFASFFLQDMLYNLMHHEVDESIWLDGRQVFNPHPELRGPTPLAPAGGGE